MRLEDAKRFYDHDDEQDLDCETDGCDGCMVKWEGDKVCNECGYMYRAGSPEHVETESTLLSERRWVNFDDRDGSGYHGHGRVRFVGGYEQAWFDDNGSLQL